MAEKDNKVATGLFLVLFLALSIPLALAEERSINNSTDKEQHEETDNTIPDGIIEGEAGITPDSHLYGIDKALERISLALTINKEKKAERRLKHAEERLLEVEQMLAEGKTEAAA